MLAEIVGNLDNLFPWILRAHTAARQFHYDVGRFIIRNCRIAGYIGSDSGTYLHPAPEIIGNFFVFRKIKSVAETKVGDTITDANNPAKEPLEGYKQANPMVFCGIYLAILNFILPALTIYTPVGRLSSEMVAEPWVLVWALLTRVPPGV